MPTQIQKQIEEAVTYPNPKTSEQVLEAILWRNAEIEEMQKTINKLCDYARGLSDYEDYKESIESYKL